MRVVLGRIALLLGVLLVAAMAWYGADSLFGDKSSEGDGEGAPPPGRHCEAGTRGEARSAERAFLRKYGEARWLSGAGIRNTSVIDSPTPPVEGSGAVLLVTRLPHAKVPGLPDCIEGVPVVYVTGGRFGAS